MLFRSDDGELGKDDGATDSSCDLLRALDAETDVTLEVTDGNEGLEAGALTSAGLLLDGHDLHDLILELGEEVVDDLVLLDGEREEVDLLHGLDLAILDETAELGDGDPGERGDVGMGKSARMNSEYSPLLLLVFAATATGAPAAPTTVTAPTSETTTTACRVSHFFLREGTVGRKEIRQ